MGLVGEKGELGGGGFELDIIAILASETSCYRNDGEKACGFLFWWNKELQLNEKHTAFWNATCVSSEVWRPQSLY